MVQKRCEAVKWYTAAADQGDPDAQYNLGECFRIGRHIKKDMNKAVELFKKAAEQGNADAQYELACLYDEGGKEVGIVEDEKEAARLYRLAAM